MAPSTATPTTTTGLAYLLHPLVLLHVSDAHTRTTVAGSSSAPGAGAVGSAPGASGIGSSRVFGLLLGSGTSRIISLENAVEIKLAKESGNASAAMAFDVPFMKQKIELMMKVFPKLDVVGWYATGSEPSKDDMALHRCITEVAESPVFLLMDVDDARNKTRSGAATAALPVKLFETEVHASDGAAHFVPASVELESSEAERVAVDEVSRVALSASTANGADGAAGAPSSSDQLQSHLHTVRSATSMLQDNVEQLLAFVRGVQQRQGPLEPKDHKALRDIAAMLRQLPASAAASNTGDEFVRDAEDVALVAQLTALTTGVARLVDVGAKSGLAYGALGGATALGR